MEDRRRRAIVETTLTAVSSKPVTPGMTHALSALDHAMGMHSIHLIFYYKESPFGSFFYLDPVWVSFSDALSLYPPITGRFTRVGDDDGKWVVKCNDAGVRALRAKVGATVDEWLRSADAVEERDLTVWDDFPEDPSIWSPFRIQLNEFEEGGIAIGLSCTHLLADLTSASVLFKSWTDISRHEPIKHPPVIQNPSPPLDPAPPVPNKGSKSYHNYYEIKSHETQPDSLVKMATATFNFSNSVMKKCISEAKKTRPGVDPFDFLCALFWTRIARRSNPSYHSLSVCMDFRKLLSMPLGQFGNFLHFFPISIPDEEFSHGPGHVAGIVHDHIEKLGQGEFRAGSERAKRFVMYGPELTCVNMEHVPIYDAMFRDGTRPIHVSCNIGHVNNEQGLIMVLPSSEEGYFARTVAVVLPEVDVARVCEDEEILKLKPRILLRGDRAV